MGSVTLAFEKRCKVKHLFNIMYHFFDYFFQNKHFSYNLISWKHHSQLFPNFIYYFDGGQRNGM